MHDHVLIKHCILKSVYKAIFYWLIYITYNYFLINYVFFLIYKWDVSRQISQNQWQSQASKTPWYLQVILLHFAYIQDNFNTKKQCMRIQDSVATLTSLVKKLAGAEPHLCFAMTCRHLSHWQQSILNSTANNILIWFK